MSGLYGAYGALEVHDVDLAGICLIPVISKDFEFSKAYASVELIRDVVILVHAGPDSLYLHERIALLHRIILCGCEEPSSVTVPVELLLYAHYGKLHSSIACLLKAEKTCRNIIIECCPERLVSRFPDILLPALLDFKPLGKSLKDLS